MKPDIEIVHYFGSDDDIRLSHDGYQWILEQEDPYNEDSQWFRDFQRVALVQSTKDVLLRSLREHGFAMTIYDRQVLAALDDDYWAFQADTLRLGTMDKVERLYNLAAETPPLPLRLVVSREARLARIWQWRVKRNPHLLSARGPYRGCQPKVSK